VISSETRTFGAVRVNNRLPLFALGFILALVAFVGVFALGRVASSAGTATVVVVSAARDIEPREVITRDALVLE